MCSQEKGPWSGSGQTGRLDFPLFCNQQPIRHRFLDAYKQDLEQYELNANAILRTFDLTNDSADRLGQVDVQANSNAPMLPSVYLEQDTNDNPYLLTPLRQKYFSKLSPTILRSILQSPPLRVPTPETSFSDDPLNIFIRQGDLTRSSLGFPNSMLPLNNDSNVFLPLTPPPTTKIPALAKFLENARVVQGVPSAESYTDNELDRPEEYWFSTESSPKPRAPRVSFVCPIARQKFQLVIDELKGTARTARRSSLALSVTSLPTPSPTPGNGPGVMSSAISCPQSSASPFPRGKRQPLLADEIMALLIQRAQHEEAEAGELRDLADRLETLARDRRKLSKVIASA